MEDSAGTWSGAGARPPKATSPQPCRAPDAAAEIDRGQKLSQKRKFYDGSYASHSWWSSLRTHEKDNFLINVSFEFRIYSRHLSCPYLFLETFLSAINEAI